MVYCRHHYRWLVTGDNDLGLIYMNARYYLPEIGRFISADTMVPEPGNPQSYNRYAYVRNNPMNFTDPTGHREIGADENDLLPNQPPPSLTEQLSAGYNVYGISFDADEGEGWTQDQKMSVLRGAAAVDRALRLAGRFSGYTPGSVFRRVFGVYSMLRSAKTQWVDNDGNTWDITYGAETFGGENRIEFYDPAFTARAAGFTLNVVHEFGHAFNSEVVARSDGNPYRALDIALDDGGQLDSLGEREGMDNYPWQQSRLRTEGELFADYFLNWVYDSFLSNGAGAGQSYWMNQHISRWLD